MKPKNKSAEAEKTDPAKKRKKLRPAVKTAIYFAVLILINLFIVNITFVSGRSMEPTLRDGQIALVLKVGSSYKTGDIVITDRKNPLDAHLVKRVIAAEGQHLVIRDQEILVDGKKLEEPYLEGPCTYEEDMDLIVPEHSLFLMGDNRAESVDSRKIGAVDTDRIIGRLILY